MGPLISSRQQKRVLGYIESGVAQGARIMTGGCALDHSGFYVQPTVLIDTQQDMKVVQEEIFGPVVVASPFDDVEEALVRANDSRYGLGASIWTQNISRMHRLVPRIKAGTVWVNTHNVLDLAVPFGGVKESGVGSELGEEAIHQHTQIKAAIINI
jgi:phenylacetaldehyde dehydrogenase